MKTFLTILIFLSSIVSSAQSLEFFKNLISPDTESVLTVLKNSEYIIKKEIPNEGCSGYRLIKDKTTLFYNICYDDDGDVIHLNLIDPSLEAIFNKLNEAMNDTTMQFKISTIEANTSFVFENDSLEMFFVFDHFKNIYFMEISNANRYEGVKEIFESNLNFNPKTNGIWLMKKILNETNSKGESIEHILKNSDIRSDFNVIEYEQAIKYIIELRNAEEFTTLKKLVDDHLLSDELYVEKIRTSLIRSSKWFEIDGNYSMNFEEGLAKTAIENNQFNSLVMFKYIIDSIKNKKRD